ncbi:MAG: nucleoside 2-deoxyribosyltransferase [Variovorax sp.]|nr:MAG: nucleoside 2-deoxyribosyltransferase [Variovorax sp.]
MNLHPFTKVVYLAGPDVFFPGSAEIFRELKEQCAWLGMIGVEPSDGGLTDGFAGSDDALAQRIFEGNIERIRGADGVIANLMSFRGHEPDSGTVFEVGFAMALGKPVVAYGVPEGSYADRVCATIRCAKDSAGVTRETESGAMVEGLGQRLNLMLARSTAIEPSAVAALTRLAAMLGADRG